jgi:hypothetical protein
VDAAEAETIGAELFFHCWCDKGEALTWARLYAQLAADERERVQARRARGERGDLYAEWRRLTEWAGIARECARGKGSVLA